MVFASGSHCRNSTTLPNILCVKFRSTQRGLQAIPKQRTSTNRVYTLSHIIYTYTPDVYIFLLFVRESLCSSLRRDTDKSIDSWPRVAVSQHRFIPHTKISSAIFPISSARIIHDYKFRRLFEQIDSVNNALITIIVLTIYLYTEHAVYRYRFYRDF